MILHGFCYISVWIFSNLSKQAPHFLPTLLVQEVEGISTFEHHLARGTYLPSPNVDWSHRKHPPFGTIPCKYRRKCCAYQVYILHYSGTFLKKTVERFMTATFPRPSRSLNCSATKLGEGRWTEEKLEYTLLAVVNISAVSLIIFCLTSSADTPVRTECAPSLSVAAWWNISILRRNRRVPANSFHRHYTSYRQKVFEL